MTNNDTAFYTFFNKLNGKVYTNPEQMRVDFNDALDEAGLTVTPKKVVKEKKSDKEKSDKKKK